MNIDIESKEVRVPTRISIDGKNYPIHQWNIEVVREYWEIGDESVLKKLKDFSLAI